MASQVQIDRDRCKGCSLCVDFCPRGRIYLSAHLNPKGYFTAVFSDLGGESDGGAPTANGAGCNGCGNCALMCPEVAIEVTRL